MQPLHFALCLFSLLSGGAQAGELSLGASLGTARGDSGAGDLSDRLRQSGLDAVASSSDDNRFAWQLRLGYAFTPRWGVEAGYTNLGIVETTFTGTAPDIDSFLSASGDIHPNTADGLLISGVYRYPMGSLPQLNAVARAGAFFWQSEYDLDGVTRSRRIKENGADLSLGLGLEFDLEHFDSLPPGITLGLDWQRFKIDAEEIDLFSLGFSYRFSSLASPKRDRAKDETEANATLLRN
ncbi:MAG: porin family protein [Candidatus Thiodiazotropha sp.]